MNNLQKTTENTTELECENANLKTRVSELELLVKFYEEQIKLAKHKQYGASSEMTRCEQLGLFDEVENEADKKQPEPTVETITYSRKKRVGKRDEDLSALPVERIEYTLPEGEVCAECGEALHTMSCDVRKELKIIPAQVKVVEHVQHIYSCRNCEKQNDHVPIVKAAAPSPVIKGSIASPSAVAQIMVQKYVNAMPLYRQEMDFLRNGVMISRQTMANWMIKCAVDWLEPIYVLMKKQLCKCEVIHADETVLQVLQELGKSANTNSSMWLYRSSGSYNPIVLYEYQPTRSSAHPKRFLEGYTGYLHTDGYAGYHNLPSEIIVVGCWAHARRKFDETLKTIPLKERSGSKAFEGLEYCNRLFALERKYEELPQQKRYEQRLEKSKPVAEAFFCWANSVNALPKSLLGKAVHYALGQRKYLENVFLDGRTELSNNRAERSIKPFVIGRKNWLFCNSTKGAHASSVIYSVIETAKENNLKPFEYLEYLLETIPNTTTASLDKLLPWSEEIPIKCKVLKPNC